MSQIRMQNHFGAVKSEEKYYIDADLLREIKQVSVSLQLCSRCNSLRMAAGHQQKYSPGHENGEGLQPTGTSK